MGKFEYSMKDVLGQGAFGMVFKGRHKEVSSLLFIFLNICLLLSFFRLFSFHVMSFKTAIQYRITKIQYTKSSGPTI